MKYMHLNSSCSYTCLAYMLGLLGFDTEDYKIALQMNLPCFIDYDAESDTYVTGFMLQNANWFNRFLIPYGFLFVETNQIKSEVLNFLTPGMMIGLLNPNNSKHAVVFKRFHNSFYYFFNPIHKESNEQDEIVLTKDELLDRMPDVIACGQIKKTNDHINEEPVFNSNSIWKQYKKDVETFVNEPHSYKEISEKRDSLFRPLLIDSLEMMKLLKQDDLVNKLQQLQNDYVSILRNKNETKNIRLDSSDYLSCLNKIIKITAKANL